MRKLANSLLNFYFCLLFFVFVAAEAANMLIVVLSAAKVLNAEDILYACGILGGIAVIAVVLTVFTYLIPLCANNYFPVKDIPNVVNEVRFGKRISLATNIPLFVSVIFSVVVLIIYKPFSSPNEIYRLLWILGLFLPVCFKVGIYYLLWSRRIKQ